MVSTLSTKHTLYFVAGRRWKGGEGLCRWYIIKSTGAVCATSQTSRTRRAREREIECEDDAGSESSYSDEIVVVLDMLRWNKPRGLSTHSLFIAPGIRGSFNKSVKFLMRGSFSTEQSSLPHGPKKLKAATPPVLIPCSFDAEWTLFLQMSTVEIKSVKLLKITPFHILSNITVVVFIFY